MIFSKHYKTIISNVLHISVLALFIYVFINSEDDWRYLHERNLASGYKNSNKMSFIDCFYFSIVTISTVGYGDIVPQSERAKGVAVYMILSTVYQAYYGFFGIFFT